MAAHNTLGNVSTVVINGSRRVTITPLVPQTQAPLRPPVVTPPVVPVINKILLKVTSKEKRGDFKMFTLRNINPTEISNIIQCWLLKLE